MSDTTINRQDSVPEGDGAAVAELAKISRFLGVARRFGLAMTATPKAVEMLGQSTHPDAGDLLANVVHVDTDPWDTVGPPPRGPLSRATARIHKFIEENRNNAWVDVAPTVAIGAVFGISAFALCLLIWPASEDLFTAAEFGGLGAIVRLLLLSGLTYRAGNFRDGPRRFGLEQVIWDVEVNGTKAGEIGDGEYSGL